MAVIEVEVTSWMTAGDVVLVWVVCDQSSRRHVRVRGRWDRGETWPTRRDARWQF